MYQLQFTIKALQVLSDVQRLKGGLPARIEMPAAWDVATITFITNGGEMQQDEIGTGAYAATVTVGQSVRLQPGLFAGSDTLQLRSGTVATPVTQSSDRVISVSVITPQGA